MYREHCAFIALQDGLRGCVAAHRDIERAVQQPRPHRRFAAVVDRFDLETILLVEFVDRHVRRRALEKTWTPGNPSTPRLRRIQCQSAEALAKAGTRPGMTIQPKVPDLIGCILRSDSRDL